jgi:hypothetical protein
LLLIASEGIIAGAFVVVGVVGNDEELRIRYSCPKKLQILGFSSHQILCTLDIRKILILFLLMNVMIVYQFQAFFKIKSL